MQEKKIGMIKEELKAAEEAMLPSLLLEEFRSGRLGKITIERP